MMRKIMITVAVAFGATLATITPASALNGNPAGETLPHCGGTAGMSRVSGPCVDTKGWGVRVRTAKGTWTQNYGPESYRYHRANGHVFYTFTADAKPYGKARFPRNVDY